MPQKLPHLLFDFGGVIINIDYNRTLEAMRQFGSGIEFTQAAQAGLFDELETGHLSPDQFRAGLREHYGLQATDAQLDAAWNAMLLDVPAERLALLAELRRQGYQTALLSNTNHLHITEINRRLKAQYGLRNGIADCLDQVFYSQGSGTAQTGRGNFPARAGPDELEGRRNVVYRGQSPAH